MLPEFPKARRKMLALWSKSLFNHLHGSDPFMSQVPIRVQKEGNTAVLGTGETKYTRHSVNCSFPTRDAEGMTIEEFFASAVKLGTEMAQQQMKGVFEAVSSPSPHAMPLRWEGALTFQHIHDTWGQMEINFDSEGKPMLPSFVVSPATQAELNEKLPQWLVDPAYKSQLTQLFEMKRKEFNEREARRRLVD